MSSVPSSQQTGTFDAVSIDGINGVQIRLPNQNGPVPLGTVSVTILPYHRHKPCVSGAFNDWDLSE